MDLYRRDAGADDHQELRMTTQLVRESMKLMADAGVGDDAPTTF